MSAPARRFAVAGGGTGGHVVPALALAERIRAGGHDVILIGSTRGLESRLVPKAGFELATLPAGQVMGRGLAARASAAVAIARGTLAAARLLRQRRIEIVLSVGGYASVPSVLAAAALRIPVALVEPNAQPGRANRLAASFARRIFVHFEEAAKRLGGGTRVQVLGVPLREALVRAFAAAPPRRAAEPPVHLLIFGGSQGARQLNDLMLNLAPRLDPALFEIFHQTGEADRERVAEGYAATKLRAEVVPFEPDMPRRYREADLALCRSGAMTVAELAMAGLPALLVPYPHAADDHQRANAQALSAAGAAVLLPAKLDRDAVLGMLESLASQPEQLRAMSAAASKLARPDAAERIVESCLELLGGGN
ncbi:MAG TPA: undecaprenyldiphospho-muramoylpentapeptide beta-N-acetylglucosaminyltransferase [Myxococcota bacterium]|nr:undecaprenyldiphospho-muramoylpentapeptide beta-N-acetylglucosaminyltransferase [Myxococcota bacterium]